jgi:D-tyrosyl-tRNA(Tyr) deacylase
MNVRGVVERVERAQVKVDGERIASIGVGLLVYVGVAGEDGETDARYLVDKIAQLRIFPDGQGKMNLDVRQIGGEVLAVSAFTVQADARKGRRPSFDAAAVPEKALQLYNAVCEGLSQAGLVVAKGQFGAMMSIEAVNDGPICILLDSKRAM